jgi:hypothetical protein
MPTHRRICRGWRSTRARHDDGGANGDGVLGGYRRALTGVAVIAPGKKSIEVSRSFEGRRRTSSDGKVHTRGIPKTRFLPVATISLFILCTAHLALLLAGTTVLDQTDKTSAVGKGEPSYVVFQLNFATNVIYVTNKCVP